MRSAWARFTGPGVSRSATGSPRRSEASGGYAGPYQGPGQSRSIEQRHGWAGALPSVGGYGGPYWGPPSMTEVPDASEHHRHLSLVRGRDDLGVTQRATGLDDRGHARLGDDVETVAEREESVGGAHGALGGEADLARAHHGQARRVHAVHLAGAHAHHLLPGGQHDRIGLGVLAHAPGEAQRRALGSGRRPLRHRREGTG